MSAPLRVAFARPENQRARDDGFDVEADALEALGVEPLWLSLDAVVEDRLGEILESLALVGGEILLRSWMLSQSDYASLYQTLADHGLLLVTTPYQYEAAHHLPQYFDAIEAHTAPTHWIEGFDLDEAWDAASRLRGPRMIKDYVKSAKEDWDAFYIAPDITRAEFDALCRRFIEHRGEHLEGGLVFRAMQALAPLPVDRGGTPAFDEYRLFYRGSERIAAAPYYGVDGGAWDFARFDEVAREIKSDFFTIDVARLVDGSWTIIEVGDGAVSSLPQLLDPRSFYRRLLIRIAIGRESSSSAPAVTEPDKNTRRSRGLRL